MAKPDIPYINHLDKGEKKRGYGEMAKTAYFAIPLGKAGVQDAAKRVYGDRLQINSIVLANADVPGTTTASVTKVRYLAGRI